MILENNIIFNDFHSFILSAMFGLIIEKKFMDSFV